MADPIQDDPLGALIDAAERQCGPEPTEDLRNALNALAQLPTDRCGATSAELAAALPALDSPSGAGLLAVWFGACVEYGADPERSLRPILETFMKWSRTIETAPEDSREADPEPDAETISGTNLLGQALVAHLTRAPEQLAAISDSQEICDEFERVEGLTHGAGWVLELLRQRSGQLVVLNIENRRGVLASYENISNCFHLFTLLQGALAGLMPDARMPCDRTLSVARGEAQDEASDQAWWHYGHPQVPEPKLEASVWGEMGPDHISRVDGVQVLLLWPPILNNRSWDAGFFGPILHAALPKVEVTRELTAPEVETWWTRLGLAEPD